jgi:hypothetical protein
VYLEVQDKARLLTELVSVQQVCQKMSLVPALDKIDRLKSAIDINDRCIVIIDKLKILFETIEDESKREQFYHYPREKANLVINTSSDWESTIKKFSSARRDIEEALDCYALDHHTACVFHLMRTAEHGLRALARSLNVSFPKSGTPINWAEWHDLIDQIRIEGKKIADALPKGAKRDAARDFYSGAVHHFEGFKDKYRNAVMHARSTYEELDALRVINQVRDFMNGLSAKIGEKTRRPIRKWP